MHTNCAYASKPCTNDRSMKLNGELHRLCAYHRSKANAAQRRWHSRKRDEAELRFENSAQPLNRRHLPYTRTPLWRGRLVERFRCEAVLSTDAFTTLAFPYQGGTLPQEPAPYSTLLEASQYVIDPPPTVTTPDLASFPVVDLNATDVTVMPPLEALFEIQPIGKLATQDTAGLLGESDTTFFL